MSMEKCRDESDARLAAEKLRWKRREQWICCFMIYWGIVEMLRLAA